MIKAAVPVWKRALGVAAFAVFGALAALVYFRNPSTSPVTFCVVRMVSGLYCPGCGATRALHLLLHGDFLGALGMNALLVPALPFVAYILIAELLRVIAGRYLLPQLPLNPWVVGGFGALFLLFGILRNLPALAFLAPG